VPGGLVRVDGPAALLDELDEPVCGVQPQLHRDIVDERTFW
jgi:hypothetical protein